MAIMTSQNKKKAISALIVGTLVMVLTPIIAGLLGGLLSIVPSVELFKIIIPHTVLFAGIAAFIADLLVDKIL